VTATPQRATEAASAAYVYGVVPAGALPGNVLADVEGVAPGVAVELVEHEGLAALVSRVPLAEFGEEPLAERLHDPAWLAQRARAHGRVLQQALAAGSVVPFRFGALFAGEDDVRALLAARGADLSEELRRLEGRVELGVKGFAPGTLAGRVRASLPEAQQLEQELAGLAPGRRYLLEKQLDGLVARETAAARLRIAEESHAALAAAAVAAVANPPRDETGAGDEEMFLNGAYLVGTGARDAFEARLEAVGARFEELGVRYELTGPWPPYNFVESARP
jgi:hypothetical protein